MQGLLNDIFKKLAVLKHRYLILGLETLIEQNVTSSLSMASPVIPTIQELV